jgi:hypothetical protein
MVVIAGKADGWHECRGRWVVQPVEADKKNVDLQRQLGTLPLDAEGCLYQQMVTIVEADNCSCSTCRDR